MTAMTEPPPGPKVCRHGLPWGQPCERCMQIMLEALLAKSRRAILGTLTICGSMKFEQHMLELAAKRTKEGWLVMAPSVPKILVTTEAQRRFLDKSHLHKIESSYAVEIANHDGYVGESTARQAAFAKAMSKLTMWTDVQAGTEWAQANLEQPAKYVVLLQGAMELLDWDPWHRERRSTT